MWVWEILSSFWVFIIKVWFLEQKKPAYHDLYKDFWGYLKKLMLTELKRWQNYFRRVWTLPIHCQADGVQRKFNTIIFTKQLTKITPRPRGIILQEISKKPRILSSELKAFSCIGKCQCLWDHHQENTEQPWCVWQGCKEKATPPHEGDCWLCTNWERPGKPENVWKDPVDGWDQNRTFRLE